MHGLTTDLYELTMAAGYYEAGKMAETATFELFVRRLPFNRNYLIAAGLQQAVDYLLNLSFSKDEVDYLRGLEQFQRVEPGFFDALLRLRFTGDLWAVREGTPLFPGEPFLTVRGPLVEAQLVETYLLATIGFQTLIATKASRTAEAACGRGVVEFGTRRAHSPEAGTLAGRAAYIGGCIGTSNAETGFRYGIPVFGTAAHSWTQSFATEMEAFQQLQNLLGPATDLPDRHVRHDRGCAQSRLARTPGLGSSAGQRQPSRTGPRGSQDPRRCRTPRRENHGHRRPERV